MPEQWVYTITQLLSEWAIAAILLRFMVAFSNVRGKAYWYVVVLAANALLVLVFDYFNPPGLITDAVLILFYFGVSKVLLKNSMRASVTVTLLVTTALAIVNNIMFALFQMALHAMDNRMSPLANYANLLTSILLTGFFLYFSYRLLPKRRIATPYLYVLWVPLGMIFVFAKLLESFYTGNISYLDEYGNFSTNARVAVSGPEVLGVFLFAGICYFVLLFSYQKFSAYHEREKENEHLEQQIALQRSAIAEAKSRYDMVGAIKHDFRNHYSVLAGLIQKGETAGALEYLEQIGSVALGDAISVDTANPVLDVLLAEKISAAQAKGITLQYAVETGKLPMEDYDLCVVVANALDNAINAAQSGAIELSIHQKKGFIILSVKNTIGKNPKHGQGYGLRNIEAVVNKYNGSMEILESEKAFELNVLLMAEKAE